MGKHSKPTSEAGPSGSAGKISDPRFASFETDPRFKLPSKRSAKTKLDKRFSRMLKDDEFTATSKVDRYGRKLKSDSKKKALERLYEPEEEESDDDDSEDGDKPKELQVDDDEVVKRELRAADKKYDPARGGGFDTSDSESDDDDDEPDVEVDENAGASIRRFQDEQADVPLGDVTNRIAIVNIDWDNIKATDLFAVFSSFVPQGGRIIKVSVYPSEFGKERMAQEEVEGPPKEIFKKKSGGDDSGEDSEKDDDEDDEDEDEKIKDELLEEGDDQDFDSDALRSYQLDRLRYYYAIMECSDEATAETIYREVDGREYLASSNFLDLRFVPNDTTFDDEPRDECTEVPAGYKPVEFVTDALQHSKVKLTWDMHPDDVARKDTINRAFKGSRNDIAENDLRAYLASDSEGDEGDEIEEVDATKEDGGAAPEAEPKLSKKELARRKMREALGLKEEPAGSSKSGKPSGPVGGMQITFTPALSGKAAAKEPEDETAIEKYARKERERKEQKREKARARREGRDPDAAPEATEPQAAGAEEDLGFDDPFFTTENPDKTATKSSIRKEERLKKRQAREAEEKQKSAERAKLELLMEDDADATAASAGGGAKGMSHFDMSEILKEEKRKGKKLKGKKAKQQAAKDAENSKNLLQEGFEMDVNDERFKAVFEDHEYAIDPSNPKFKATSGMKKLLEKGRSKRRRTDEGSADDSPSKGSKKAKGAAGSGDLAGLVESVKRKSKKQ
ncbi:hypothetical protein RB595_002216 [Gaeumannomyces hyphopodioides]